MNPRVRQEQLIRRLSWLLSGVVCVLLLAMLLAGQHEIKEIVMRSIVAILLSILFYRIVTRKIRRREALRKEPFPVSWEAILQREVPFYQSLDENEKARFREEVRIFLSEKRITGIKTSVDETTRLLVAASAIIPIFGFPGWEWDQISEVLIYPSSFNDHYETDKGVERDILGMVGRGAMTRMMILSKPDLLQGFRLPEDRKNVGIHEFAHLLDKTDGAVDGVPAVGLPKSAIVPWLKVVHREMAQIQSGYSDITAYGLKNEAEFFAVVAEYFFENPERMQRKHPELFAMLEQIFHQHPRGHMKRALVSMVIPYGKRLSRNAPCPCGSGKKYKRCCLARN